MGTWVGGRHKVIATTKEVCASTPTLRRVATRSGKRPSNIRDRIAIMAIHRAHVVAFGRIGAFPCPMSLIITPPGAEPLSAMMGQPPRVHPPPGTEAEAVQDGVRQQQQLRVWVVRHLAPLESEGVIEQAGESRQLHDMRGMARLLSLFVAAADGAWGCGGGWWRSPRHHQFLHVRRVLVCVCIVMPQVHHVLVSWCAAMGNTCVMCHQPDRSRCTVRTFLPPTHAALDVDTQKHVLKMINSLTFGSRKCQSKLAELVRDATMHRALQLSMGVPNFNSSGNTRVNTAELVIVDLDKRRATASAAATTPVTGSDPLARINGVPPFIDWFNGGSQRALRNRVRADLVRAAHADIEKVDRAVAVKSQQRTPQEAEKRRRRLLDWVNARREAVNKAFATGCDIATKAVQREVRRRRRNREDRTGLMRRAAGAWAGLVEKNARLAAEEERG